MKSVSQLALALALGACASAPKPPVLSEVESQESSAQMQEAAQLVPQSFAHAKQLRERSQQAWADGKKDEAELLAAHADAALKHTWVLARAAKAEQRQARATARRVELERRLSELQAQQQEAEASARAAEAQVNVFRDLEAAADVETAAPKREAARRKAGKALSSEAELLCASARLLDPSSESAGRLLGELKALKPKFDQALSPSPIGEAHRLRAACLAVLTRARRPARQHSPESEKPDALLAQLSTSPDLGRAYRDDRGVVLAFDTLNDKRLERLAKVAGSHPELKLLLVLRGRQPRPAEEQSALKKRIEARGLDVKIADVGNQLSAGIAPTAGRRTPRQWMEWIFVHP